MKQRSRKLASRCSLTLIAMSAAAAVMAEPTPTASLMLDSSHLTGGLIPDRFLGISIEWTLIERYMNPNARPAFINLLRNMGSGYIRVGGGSQETVPYSANATNTDRIITNADFTTLRETLDTLNAGVSQQAVPRWGVVLGAALGGSNGSQAQVRSFVDGIAATFAGSERYVAGIGLGNEPDGGNFTTYLNNIVAYANPSVTANWPLVLPSTSNDILPWTDFTDPAHPIRWFWNWQQILDTAAPFIKARAGVFGPWVSDHFYPLARNCSASQPWRCGTIPILLSKEHLDTLDYQVYIHATMSAAHDVPFRLEETNTAARQGIAGVSDVYAAAPYALDMMFHVACPQPPHLPGGNADCSVQGVGVNLQNAARNGNTNPEQGNAYYNVINFDPSPAMGPPVPAAEYYAALLFAHAAQGTSGLRRVTVSGQDAPSISAWRLEAGAGERRLVMINKSATTPVTVNVSGAASRLLVNRMTPFDPTGTGKTLDATSAMVDGRQVNADGSWPGFAPTSQALQSGATTLTLAPGEAVVAAEYPAYDLRMVPAVQNLRTTAGVVSIVLTAASGDLSLWDVSNLRLQGAAALSVAPTSDRRTFVATFNKSALQSLPTGDAVTASLTGDIKRDGLVTPFTATTTIRVVR